MRKLFLCLGLMLVFCLSAEIFEIKHISEINKYLKDDQLILFDLDNTVLRTAQLLGSDQWFDKQLLNYLSKGFTKQEAFEKAYLDYLPIIIASKVVPVEKDTVSIIKALQNKHEVLALTTRSFDSHCATFSQLKSINIDFSKFSLCSKELYFEGEYYSIYKNGILFTNGNNKGEILEKFLDNINFHPKEIIYIDDKLHHLQRVEKICQKKNIPYIGLRYGFLDDAVKNFDSSIAEIQFKNFGKFLSDEDVKNLSK